MKYLTIIFLFTSLASLAQSRDLNYITKAAAEIDKAPLDVLIVDYDSLEQYFEHPPDRGAEVIILYDSTGIRKVKFTIGISNGMTEKVIYYENGQPMMITETNYAFPYDEDRGDFDYDNIEEKCHIKLFIKDPNVDKASSGYYGECNITKDRLHPSDYQWEMDLVKKLFERSR